MCISNFLKLTLFTFCIGVASNTYSDNKHDVIIDGGMVHLKGKIVGAACTVAIESKHQVVDMGKIRSNFFSGVGSDALPVPFFIKLTDCSSDISNSVGVGFWGNIDTKNPNIFKVTSKFGSGAEGIGVALFTSSNDLILPNTQISETYTLHNGDNRLQFIAKYRATSLQIKPGIAEAVTWFSLTYH